MVREGYMDDHTPQHLQFGDDGFLSVFLQNNYSLYSFISFIIIFFLLEVSLSVSVIGCIFCLLFVTTTFFLFLCTDRLS